MDPTLKMSDLPEFGLRARTHIAHQRLLTAIHEHALWMASNSDGCADDVVGWARQHSHLAQQLKTMGVLKARVVYEASWEEIAQTLGLSPVDARKIYEDAERRWLSGDLTPWVPQGRSATVKPMLRRIRGTK